MKPKWFLLKNSEVPLPTALGITFFFLFIYFYHLCYFISFSFLLLLSLLLFIIIVFIIVFIFFQQFIYCRYVYEVPGGSSWEAGSAPLNIALEEVEEECGIKLDPSRLQVVNSRQLVIYPLYSFLSLFSSFCYSWFISPLG